MEKEKNLGGRPPHDLDQLADELLYWSTEPTSFNLIGFSRPRCISVTRLPAWAKEHTRFGEALALAKESIAMNRFEASLSNEFPHSFFKSSEGQYDPLHNKYLREEKAYESSLRTKENNEKPTQTYVYVNDGLASGANVPTKGIPASSDKGSE